MWCVDTVEMKMNQGKTDNNQKYKTASVLGSARFIFDLKSKSLSRIWQFWKSWINSMGGVCRDWVFTLFQLKKGRHQSMAQFSNNQKGLVLKIIKLKLWESLFLLFVADTNWWIFKGRMKKNVLNIQRKSRICRQGLK